MIIRYIISFAVFVLVDAVWLVFVAPNFYRTHIGHLMREQADLRPAVVFYLVFLAGLNLFVLEPQNEKPYRSVALHGAAFGCVTYATFDLTSQAVFTDFPAIVSVVDILWGSFLAMSISVITTWLYRKIRD